MTVLRPRTKLVYFRISEEDFEQLQHLCGTGGSRSISDLARTAVRALLDRGTEEHIPLTRQVIRQLLNEQLEVINGRLQAIEDILSRLSVAPHQEVSSNARSNTQE